MRSDGVFTPEFGIEKVADVFIVAQPDNARKNAVRDRTVRFPDATVAGEPITRFDSASMGASSYRELAREVLERWRQAGPGPGG